MSTRRQGPGWVSCLSGLGIVFASLLFSTSGSAQTLEVLYRFTGTPDGQSPDTNLIRDEVRNFYGVTYGGGVSFGGTAFQLTPSGEEKVLYDFLAGYGEYPNTAMVRDEEGTLYGTTAYGGAYAAGAIFKIDCDGNETVIYSFPGQGHGYSATPNALIRDAQGNLYGATMMGGTGGCFGSGCGTLYKLDRSGRATLLYSFTGGSDGGYPSGPIARDEQGNLYGATAYGGDRSCFAPYGCGVVFEVDTSGKETVLHTFTGKRGDGAGAWSGVARDAQGNLYGATTEGGTGLNCTSMENGCGIVYRIDATGKETILHSFSGKGADHGPVYAPLTLDTQGNIYGTSPNGGSQNCGSGCGSIFILNSMGKVVMLYEFTGGSNGQSPLAGVFVDTEGNIYGTTASGGDLGCNNREFGCGTVFKLTP